MYQKIKINNMKKYLYSLIAFCIVVMPQIVNAQIDLPSSSDTGGLPAGGGGNVILPIIEKVVKFVVELIGSIAVLMIVVAGIMYITSGGDSTRTETAKKILTYAIVGLIIAILAYTIVIIVGETLGASWT